MSHNGFKPFTRDSDAANGIGPVNTDILDVGDQFNELAAVFTALRNELLSQADLIPLGFQLLPTDLSRAFDIPLPSSGFCPGLMQPQTAGLRPGLSMDQQDLITGDSSGHTTITNLLPLSTQFAANQLFQQQQQQQQQQPIMFEQEGWTAGCGGYQINRGMGSNSAEVKSSHTGDLSAEYKSQAGFSRKRSLKSQQSSEPRPNARAVKRQCLVWTDELHQLFMWAVEQLGPEKAVPKAIMNLMNVRGLTRENIASHLQKYRQLKEIGGPEKSTPMSTPPPSSLIEGRSADGITQQGAGVGNSIERPAKTTSRAADKQERSVNSVDKRANSQQQDQGTASMDLDIQARRQEKAEEAMLNDYQDNDINLDANEQGGSNGTNGSSGVLGGHSMANGSNGQSSFILGPNHPCSRGTQGSNGGSNGDTNGQHSNGHTKGIHNRHSQARQRPEVVPSANQDDMVQHSTGNNMLQQQQRSNGHTNKNNNLHSNGHSGVRHNATSQQQPEHDNNMEQDDNNGQHSNGHSGVRHKGGQPQPDQTMDDNTEKNSDEEMQNSNGHTKRDQYQHSNGHSNRHQIRNQISVPNLGIADAQDVTMNYAKEVQNSNTNDMQRRSNSNGHSKRENPQHSNGHSQRQYGHIAAPLQKNNQAMQDMQLVNNEVQNSNNNAGPPHYGHVNNQCSNYNNNQEGRLPNDIQNSNSNGHTNGGTQHSNGHTNGGTQHSNGHTKRLPNDIQNSNSNGHTNGGTQHSNGHTKRAGDLHSNGDSGVRSRDNREQIYTDIQVSNSNGGTNGGTQYTSGQSKCEQMKIDNDNDNDDNENDDNDNNLVIPLDLVSNNQNQNQQCVHVTDMDVALLEDDQLNNDIQNSNSYYCSGATFGSNGQTNNKSPPQ